ncbi:hypothetical protein FOA52_000182 [Chlamydomonas sp. UWO 241]|nr:hypothetical protein FOA52_000182 [Chlamydomonas sp. UWO 241]
MPIKAVHLLCMDASAVTLTDAQVASLEAAASWGTSRSVVVPGIGSTPRPLWRRCPMANQFGIPLMLLQLAPTTAQHVQNRPNGYSENPAFLMLSTTDDGLAPPEFQINGVGPVLLARTDGVEFTVDDMWHLHDYQSRLMDYFPDWNGVPLM